MIRGEGMRVISEEMVTREEMLASISRVPDAKDRENIMALFHEFEKLVHMSGQQRQRIDPPADK